MFCKAVPKAPGSISRAKAVPKGKSSRPRAASETIMQIAGIVSDYIQSPKKVGKIEGKRVKRSVFQDHSALLKKLKAAQDNLSFSPAFMKEVCEEVGKKHQSKWKHSPQDTQEFAATMGPRLRVLCRQFQQNIIKPQPPKWAVEVLKGPSQSELPKKQPTAAAAAAVPLAEEQGEDLSLEE